MTTALPERARIVVVGGGVIGTSIAYHLALEGIDDVLLLERHELTSGTTWHAAGLQTSFGSTSQTSTELRLYSRDLYARLEAETGLSTGFRPVGLIEAAADEGRLEEYRRVAAFQRRLGLEVHEISPREMSERFPWARTDDLLAGFWVPGDGRVNPVDVTMSLAKGARQRGVRIVSGVSVSEVLTRPRGAVQEVVGVRAAYQGEIVDVACETVVNAAGMWARELAARNGVVVPNQAAEHYYLITDTIDGIDPDGPIFEDPAAHGYYREEGGGLMVGLFEPVAAAWRVDGIPADFAFGTIPPDWERVGPFLQTAMERVPITLETGVRTLFCGPESFTPDLRPAVGEAPGIHGYFVAAGLNSVGILSGGGLGRIVAHWIATGTPDVDVTGFDAARFHDWQLDPAYRRERIAEVLGTVYGAHPPGTQLTTARGVRRSPVQDELAAAGGIWRDVSGFDSALVYDPQGTLGGVASAGWGPQPWWPLWEEEHRAIREGAGVMDMSFMARFEVRGPDAAGLLEQLSTARVGEPGRITYSQWLDDAGHLLADVTVAPLGPDRFWVIASDTAHQQALGLLRRAVGERQVTVTDVTADWAFLTLQGPRSGDVLAALGEADLAGAPFRTFVATSVSGVDGHVARMSYAGELGFEFSVPAADGPALWRALVGAGARPCGLAALASLRLEKGFRDYGHDIDNTDTPGTAGLAWNLASDKDFRGRDAALAERSAGAPHARLVSVVVPGVALEHAEVVLRDGVPVGDVRAGSYGWTVGGGVGLAFVEACEPVTAGWLAAGSWAVDIAGTRHPATVSLRAPLPPVGS